jgi:hypothetical protein
MNEWGKKTVSIANKSNYLDQLQSIYSHEEGERVISAETIQEITEAFKNKNQTKLINLLLGLEKFPYKDSYVAFLRKDRKALERNPQTLDRIFDKLMKMGLDKIIEGVSQAKEANMRRGPQFRAWLYDRYTAVEVDEFRSSKKGILLLDANELDAKDFCNRVLKVGITKRPDLVAKVDTKFIIGESKFLSSTGGNQGRGFDDGVKLASNADGIAYKVFILDGVLWIETGSEQYNRIDNSNALIFSALLLDDFFESVKTS